MKKLLRCLAALCLVASASFANAQSCSSGGQNLGEMGPPDSALLFNTFAGRGTYEDCYTFHVNSSASSGGVVFDFGSVDVATVSLLQGTSSLGSFTNPLFFGFSTLAGGVDYTLKIVSTVTAGWGGYVGVLQTYAAPVPEPSTVAMMLLGLLGLGFALRRNSR